MEIGAKIKYLRCKAGLTQEQLAEKLGLSGQSVSKWENAVAMPDITLLPGLAEEFGVSIDELFDLTREQKLRRMENRMDQEEELPGDVFREYEEFLGQQLAADCEKERIYSLLAHLYHHRMQSDARKVSRHARQAIKLAPEKKDCQWLLCMAEGHFVWDWNVANHAKAIELYKELIAGDDVETPTPMSYYWLLDNLIADHRTEEALEYLEKLRNVPAHRPFLIPVYRAHIALAQYDEPRADGIMEQALAEYADDSGFLFETAQYYARKCEYGKAIEFYNASYDCEAGGKPRYIDALQGIAVIYEIMGECEKAAETYDRILDNMKNEWGLTEETEVKDAERERSRLLRKARKG